jgi:superfamily II DNA/RNA helicase
MADFLRQHGRRAVAVHSGETSAPRAQSLDELSEGRLDVICAVDVFNEGLDLPELDTVLMLRPTESRILWLQQFGRAATTAPSCSSPRPSSASRPEARRSSTCWSARGKGRSRSPPAAPSPTSSRRSTPSAAS